MAAPSPAPANLSLTRGTDNDGCCIVAKWGNPADGQTETDHKWDGVDATWWFRASRDMSYWVVEQRGGGHPTGNVIWVRDQGIHETETVYYNREVYHPRIEGRYLNEVETYVYAFNGETDLAGGTGQTRNAAGARMTYRFRPPRAPEWEDPSIDPTNGRVSAKLTTDEGKDERERYDTLYRITRQDSANRGNRFKTAQTVVGWTSTTDKEATPHYDVAEASQVQPGQWIRITFEAKARGLAGDSEVVSKTFVASYPAVASIQRITATSLDSTGIVTVHLATNQSGTSPVDSVQLQRLANVDISTADEAFSASGWSDVSGSTDNGLSTGLSDLVPDAIPDRGKRTWYRVLSKHGNLSRYSQPVEARVLFRPAPTAEDDSAVVASAVSGDDGTSIVLVTGHDADDSTGTQVAWSDKPDAWESTEQPSTYDVTWHDAASQSADLDFTSTLVIRGLETGVPYYIRARRYLEDANGNRTYSPWGYPAEACYPLAPTMAPSDVRLSAPSTVARGSELPVTWTFASDSRQTAWNLFAVDGSRRTLLASGIDSSGAATVPAERLDGLDSVTLSVSVTTGGAWAESPSATVGIADRPSLVMAVSETLRVQPLRLFLSCSSPDASVAVKVTARGCAGDAPYGRFEQLDGDVVWSSLERPDWADGGDGLYYSPVVAPDGLDFANLAEYDIEAVARDGATGLESDSETARISVMWAHMAQLPQGCEVTADGSERAVVVTPSKPFNWAEGDVYDVYRMTPDGPSLIAEGQQFGTSVIDRFAPYAKGGCSVRVAVRTTDGHAEWADYPYSMSCGGMRIDWDGKRVDLPYNISASDSYAKDFEARAHFGGKLAAGYWNAGRERTASLSTDLIRLKSQADAALVRGLASWTGPAFVRLPDGTAYEANVDVSGLDWECTGGALAVSLSATEVGLTDDFSAQAFDVAIPDGYEPPSDGIARSQILRWGPQAPEPGERLSLNEEPGGAVAVTLQASADGYSNAYPVPCEVSEREVTLGAFGADLEAFLAIVAQSPFPQYLLTATYMGGE